jgi:WhiB family redox-sensing transcriptional regulator
VQSAKCPNNVDNTQSKTIYHTAFSGGCRLVNDNLNAVKSDWRQARACLGVPTEVFFPEIQGNSRAAWLSARTICASCPVIEQCRSYCDEQEAQPDVLPYGMWAGETPGERKYRRYETQSFGTAVHGTRSMWTRGCRCQPCVTANYQRIKSYKDKGKKES